MGFVQGGGSLCNFYNKDQQLRVHVHGDECAVLGSMPDLKWLWTIKETGILGPLEIEETTQKNSTSQSIDVLGQRRCDVRPGSEACGSRDPRIVTDEISYTDPNPQNLERVCS